MEVHTKAHDMIKSSNPAPFTRKNRVYSRRATVKIASAVKIDVTISTYIASARGRTGQAQISRYNSSRKPYADVIVFRISGRAPPSHCEFNMLDCIGSKRRLKSKKAKELVLTCDEHRFCAHKSLSRIKNFQLIFHCGLEQPKEQNGRIGRRSRLRQDIQCGSTAIQVKMKNDWLSE